MSVRSTNSQVLRKIRHTRIRSRVHGSAERLRLSVSRSIQHVYAQVINDETGRTLAAVHDSEVKGDQLSKTAIAHEVGLLLAQKAKTLGLSKVVFDRGGFRYHGRVKAEAEGARKGGLQF